MCYLDHYDHLQTRFSTSRGEAKSIFPVSSHDLALLHPSTPPPPHAYNPYTLSAALYYLQGPGRTPLRLAGGAHSDTAFSCHNPSHAGSSDGESLQSPLTGPHIFLPPHCALHTVEHSSPPRVCLEASRTRSQHRSHNPSFERLFRDPLALLALPPPHAQST